MEKSMWLVISGGYEIMCIEGCFKTEEEAREYCELKNKYNYYGWNRLDYEEVKMLSLEEIKKLEKTIFIVRGRLSKDKDLHITSTEKLTIFEEFTNQYSYNSIGKDVLFRFKVIAETKEEAERISYEVFTQVKDKFEECGSWSRAIKTVGGYYDFALL